MTIRSCSWRAFIGALVVVLSTVNLAGVAFAAPPALPPASQLAAQPEYFYDATGRRDLTISATDFLVALRPVEDRAVTARPDFLPPNQVTPQLRPAAVKLELRLAKRGLHIARGANRTELEARPEVEYVMPILYRTGSDVPIYANNRIVLRLREGVDPADLEALAQQVGATVEKQPFGENRYVLTVADVAAVNPIALANFLHEQPAFTEYAEPDFFLPKVTYAPPVIQDPYYLSHQWHLDGDVLKGAVAGSDMNVEAAWDTAYGPNAEGSPTVHVAIVDECVEKLHPDLFPNWRAGLDVDDVPYDDDPSPDAGQRHGTACAGLAVAKGNSIGVRGVSPNSGLIGVKFFGGTNADTANAYLFCKDPNNDGNHADGAAVVSNSWGYADGTVQPTDVVAAINNLATTGRNGKGVLVLFASANNDHTINGVSALAQLDTVMAIGGTNSNNEHTEFSDVGPEMALATPTNDRGDDGVRLPWLNITSVDNTGSSGYNGLPDLDYTNDFGGTSAATPIAAGLLALILSHDENMTSAQVRAIAQHTAVRIDEPYGRFDPITGHSHRYGYGRGDAAAAIAAVAAGIRWPDRIRSLTITGAGNDISMFWSTPAADYAGSLLVRSNKPFGWMPTDGQTYTVGQEVAPGVTVIYNGVVGAYTDVGATTGGFFYAVYPRSPANYYGFGAKGHLIRNGATVFYDNSEIIDPGWTHGGLRDEWTRGTPTSSLGIFGQVVNGSGPLAGTRGFRAINGNRCWGTDMQSTYNANADAWLQTPIINLTGVNVPVFLEYWDWSLLETFYDRCTVEAVDADGNFLGYIDPDTCGDYDWTQRVYDLTPYAGQAIRVRFRLTSDSILQRDGWFIDEVRVTVAENVPLPPTATPIYTETTENTAKPITLTGSDPNVGTTLAYVITSLPTNGQLSDPEAGPITTVPYTLAGNFRVVIYTPNSDYQGPESFTYQVFDGGLSSNNATVKVSVGTPVEIYNFPLTTDPGWITEGFWAFGKPNGIGGDPTSGNTGLNVYGYNLNGQYANDIKAESLIMAPINCTGLSRVTLSFARWLGVESGNFDNASIEVSADGVNWSPVWANGSTAVIDTSWSIQTFNIGAVADDQPFVQVRWVMGPTDSNTTYAGWNIDDVRILAIGTPAGNQPPMARPVNGSTATSTMIALDLDGADPDDEDLSYTITSLPLFGTISDPNGGEITTVPYTLPPGFRTVEYLPDADFGGFDEFNYQVSDGELNSNVARVVIEVLNPAPFPFEEDFEGGPVLVSHWSTNSTGVGRILVTDRYEPKDNWHIVLDSGAESSYALNELTLVVDLEGQSNVLLYYDWKDFADEVHPAPNSWVGSIQGDAVAISTDGSTWYKLADLHDPNKAAAGDEEAEGGLRAAAYQTVLIDLDDAMAAFGLNYSQTVRIRFIQYDNNPVESDGLALDNIRVVQGTDDPLIVTSVLPEGTVNEPYPPFQIDTFGGDLPLVWTMPTIFTEESLGAQPFPTGGVAQNWRADDAAFDYTLPFPFPFYGGSYTDLKIATDGWINFGPYVGSTYNNSTAALMANKRIAVMWDDLRTDKPGGDIYVDESVPGQVTFRWAAATRNALGNTPCNFAATLFDDGTIRLDYGSGNTPLTPTVGLSAGDNSRYFLTSYDGAASLGDAASLFLDFSRLPPGMSMDAAGVVSGTPTDAGVFHPLIIIEDQRGRSDQKVLTITVTSDLFGDFDGDGDIDLVDLGSFVACLEAPAPDGDCLEAFDADGSAIVDLYDFAAFQRAFTE